MACLLLLEPDALYLLIKWVLLTCAPHVVKLGLQREEQYSPLSNKKPLEANQAIIQLQLVGA